MGDESAEAGDEVILGPAVRLVAVKAAPARAVRRKVIERARCEGVAKAVSGVSAARSQDMLYDEDGLPK
jgi:hypothetical protein